MKRDYQSNAATVSPTSWRDLSELCQRVHGHLYEHGNKTAARRYRRRLEKSISELPENDVAILREEALALLHELADEIPQAIRRREREIELIERLHHSVRESIRAGRYGRDMGRSILSDWNRSALRERHKILRRLRSYAAAGLLLLAAMAAQHQPMFLSTAAAQSPSASPQAPVTESDADEPPASPKAEQLSDPELVALTWQYGSQANHKRRKQPVWRPDGTRLTDAETIALLDQLKSFQAHWRQPKELTPLVMVFRRPGPIKTGLSTALVLDGRRVQSGGTWGPFDAHGLAKAACAPLQDVFAKWPESVVIDAKVPLEDPQIIKTVTAIPDGAVQVAPGVRWYIDPNRGIEFGRGDQPRRDGLKAAVFEVEDETFENLVTYQSAVWIREKERPLPDAYATGILLRPGVWATLRVSKPLDDVSTIEKVEFSRQRFKIQRFNDVKLRVDLLLPSDGENGGDDKRRQKSD